jgi:hypothetical protein
VRVCVDPSELRPFCELKLAGTFVVGALKFGGALPVPNDILFEASDGHFLGKRILNDSDRRGNGDFGQGGFLGT